MALDALEGCYPDKAAQSMAQIDAAVALRTALAAPSEELELPKVRLWEFLELIKDKEDFRGIPIMRTEWPTREEALAADEPSANRLTQPEQEPVAAALRHAAQVVQLYDDACSDNNYMLDSNDCEGILNALADYYDAGYTAPPQQLKQKPVAQVQVAEDYYPHVVFLDGVDTTALDQKFLYTAPQQPDPPCKTGSQCVGGKCERCALEFCQHH